MEFPTDTAIVVFHQANAPTDRAFDVIYTYSRIIADIAAELIAQQQLAVDSQLVHAAALLHDVGYYALFNDSGYVPQHGIVGAGLLRHAEMSEAIVRVAERHTGFGLTKDYIIAAGLPLPYQDFIAETLEESLIMYADKFHTKHVMAEDPKDSLGRFNSVEEYLVHAGRYGTPDMAQLSKRYEQSIS
jgi:uncharacterized protein